MLVLLGCASMGPPTGGPEDLDAPAIVSIEPVSGSTLVDPKTPIVIIFSEPITKASLKEALYITPTQQDEPKIKINGKRVQIRLNDPIPVDQTLVLTIGSGVSDLRRNEMEESVSVAITAGERINKGKIVGSVFTDKAPKGILVGAWLVSDSLEINPSEQSPPLLTQTGKDGKFNLDYLSSGKYRLVSWDDADHDRLYNSGKDKLGLPWKDIELGVDSIASIDLYPTKHDTTRLRPLLISSSDNRHMILRFSIPVSGEADDIRRGVTIAADSLQIKTLGSWWSSADSSRLVLFTSVQIEQEYRVQTENDSLPLIVTGTTVPDTVGPRIVASYPVEGSKQVSPQVEGWIGFDDALSYIDYKSIYTFIVSDTLLAELEFWQDEPHIIRWKVIDPLPLGSEVYLELKLNQILDLSGNASPDSMWYISFDVANPSDLGAISGTVSGRESKNIMVVARQIGGRSGQYFSHANQDGTFEIDNLSEGKFIVWAFEDSDLNKRFGFGNLDPFQFAERFTVHPDTVLIQARWETGGVDINFGK